MNKQTILDKLKLIRHELDLQLTGNSLEMMTNNLDELIAHFEPKQQPQILVNLDRMTAADLKLFMIQYRRPSKGALAKLFGVSGPKTKMMAQRLASYAEYRLDAMTFREAGKIGAAMQKEKLLDDMYKTFPDWCKW